MKDKYSRYYTKVKFVYLLIVFDKLFQKNFCVYGQVQLNVRKDRLMSVLLQIRPLFVQPASNMSQVQSKKNKNTKLDTKVLIFTADHQNVKNAKIQKHETNKYKIKVPILLSTDQQHVPNTK